MKFKKTSNYIFSSISVIRMWLNAFIWQRLEYFVTVKTKSIAPYETDVPVKIGAAESLFKTNDQGKIEKY